jgi:hypothetical protein
MEDARPKVLLDKIAVFDELHVEAPFQKAEKIGFADRFRKADFKNGAHRARE